MNFLISSRDTNSIVFTLSFMVSQGPPSRMSCYHNEVNFLTGSYSRQNPLDLSREVVRSHYINSSYPDITRVTLTHTTLREPQVYSCTMTVEGHVSIEDNNAYDYAPLGSGTTTANITGECVSAPLLITTSSLPPSPPQLQALQLMSLLTGLVMTVLVFPGLPHQQEHHQLAMRCSIS